MFNQNYSELRNGITSLSNLFQFHHCAAYSSCSLFTRNSILRSCRLPIFISRLQRVPPVSRSFVTQLPALPVDYHDIHLYSRQNMFFSQREMCDAREGGSTLDNLGVSALGVSNEEHDEGEDTKLGNLIFRYFWTENLSNVFLREK